MTHTDHSARRGITAPPRNAPGQSDTDPLRLDPTQPEDDPDTGDDEVSPVLVRQIDENLRKLYRQRLDQALPSELEALVEQLRDGGKEQRVPPPP